MTDDRRVAPALTNGTSATDRVEGQGEVVEDGVIDLRKTHPSLYRALMTFAVLNVLLGANFIFLHPTFLIFATSNYVWGAIFITLGALKVVLLNLVRDLTLVRLTMAVEVAFMLFIALGATEPFLTGRGSLQNPILYLGMSVIELMLLLEPFINPWTARRD